MPTIKPRVQVTLEPEVHAVIERLAHLQGRTRGAVIADLLDSVAPALTRTVALIEAAAAAPEQVKAGLRQVVADTHDELVGVSGDAIKQMDFLLGELSGDGADPHVVTRGSGIPTDTPPSTRKTPRKRSKSGGVANG
jgi:hypothetical protein